MIFVNRLIYTAFQINKLIAVEGLIMDDKKLFAAWLENATDDKDLTEELKSIENNDQEIYDRFYTALKFGTAGLRGVIGAGTNRMNIYVVRQATQGLANYVLNKYG